MKDTVAPSQDMYVSNDCLNATLTSTPPNAPIAPAIPISAPASRRPSRSTTAASAPPVTWSAALARKIAGIILYVDPLPTPENTNNEMNPTRNSDSDFCCEASRTTPALAAISTKFQNVTTEPPIRSASQPPTGRISEPSSGPRKVRYAASMAVLNSGLNCTWSTCPKAKPKPMNEPKVPM